MQTKILLFLFGLGFVIKVNLVGVISLSELFLVGISPLYLLKINWKQRELFTVLLLYASLLFFQVLSEIVVGNTLSAALKGLAITVVSFLHFAFLYRYLQRDLSLLVVLLLSLAVSQLLAGPEEVLTGETFTSAEMMENIGSKILKFYVAPIVINLLLWASIVLKWDKFSYVVLVVGIIFIALGARSSGFTLFLTGVVSTVIGIKPAFFTKKNLLKGLSVISLLGYSLYCIYAMLVLNAGLVTGNSEQLLNCDNPYNPFELLLRGRTEVWVGWQAFMDRFFFGHGAWAYDPTGYYLRLMAKLQQSGSSMVVDAENAYLIPSHSVLIGAGMMNGVFAFVSMLVLMLFFVKRGIFSLSKIPSKYRIVFVSFFFTMVWTFLFSPASHFRLTLPVQMAGILVLYRKFARLA